MYTPDLLSAVATVERLIGKVDGLQLARAVPRLRRENRIRSVWGSTGIEGNTATVDQVEALMRDEEVALPRSEKIEIRNALRAYGALETFDPYSSVSLLEAHAMLMGNGLMLSAGHFRRGPVEVYVTETTTRSMPHWQLVESATEKLLELAEQSDDTMLLKSTRFHFELVNIHPFLDGNGRLARLWQSRLLMEDHPIFEFLDVESMVFQQREEYYHRIRQAQDSGDVGCFCIFMLEQLRRSLDQLWEKSANVSISYDERIAIAGETFGDTSFARQDYLRLHKTISQPTASRDLASAVKAGTLTRSGNRRTTIYRFDPSAALPMAND